MNIQLQVKVHKTIEAAERMLPEWTALWERCSGATTFQRPEWIIFWMRMFQPQEPLIVEVRNEGRLVGIAPFLIYTDGSERILGLTGGGVSDYLDVIAETEIRKQTTSASMRFITRPEFQWDVINLTDLSPGSPLLTLADYGLTPNLHDVCTQLVLTEDTEHIKKLIPKHKYENLRNARSRLRKSGEGNIEIATRETLNEFLEALFELHGTRWGQLGQPGVLFDRSTQCFHRETAPLLLSCGVLRLYGLRLRGRLIATLYSFFEREVVYCYMQGFDPSHESLSPGTLLLGTVIEDALQAGKKCINFLRGQESYKYTWGVKDSPSFRIQADRTLVAQIAKENSAAA
ncbi:MAG TPA: GNAT family N-acetyltransferase [Terriglobales bacterium]|nr:GNAT family N-acetyltransferase [Terriglobales bacterium]